MPVHKKEEWIEAREAVAILSENSGRDISMDYLRVLARGELPHIRTKPKDKRQKLYLKSDVEGYKVKQRTKKQEPEAVEENQ